MDKLLKMKPSESVGIIRAVALVAVPILYQTLDLDARLPFTTLSISTLLLTSLLVHLVDDFVGAIEHPSRWRTTCPAFGRLCEALDGARGAKVVATAGNDRICIRFPTNQTGERDVLIVTGVGS